MGACRPTYPPVVIDLRVISIGTLASHPLWNERAQVRTGHATTTLVRSGDRVLLVDPGLPAQALVARLAERANIAPTQVTDVFLTCFKPDVRRAIVAFEGAEWWIAESEREQVGTMLASRLRELGEDGDADDQLKRAMGQDVAILQRCRPAPDELIDSVALFPLPGVTPGMSGLLVEEPRHTTLVCGDAIPTVEHLIEGKVLQGAVDVEKARASFAEAVEIADLLVLGRDNLVVNPTKRPF
jgi:glyoxylase-like metal-dependent hydrolase (beta-lactamase superfamily II)